MNADEPSMQFPDDFCFGVATSAYQVEGGIENDWSDWERAGKLKDPNARCGQAVDHWKKFDADLALVKSLGATAYRFSFEWARIEPRQGEFNAEAISEYRRRLESLRALGLRPIVTLHHFTNPPWLHHTCGWHTASVLEVWRKYVKVCVDIVDGLDAAIVTFNEPMVFLLGGYVQGVMPPGLKESRAAMAAIENIARAHVIAREELLKRSARITCGIAQHVSTFAPERRWHPLDHALVRIADEQFNHGLLRALTTGTLRLRLPPFINVNCSVDGAKDSMEFLGVNYYTRTHLKFVASAPFVEFKYIDASQRGLTDLGWEVFPEGFLQMLRQMKQYKLPVWVTENGIDDRAGTRRSEFIYQHLKALLTARSEGVNVNTYLHWSLLDNFEWLDSWGPRFGLFHVDFKTLERKPTPAADYFRSIATTKRLVAPNGLTAG